MRLLKLELEKFGAFESLRIAFRPDARLHVVYGPNEAGKSTALAAVGALLFGVPERTPYVFRFTGQDLRIGAQIAAGDGRTLTFRRRKGRKNTLQDVDGRPLPDDALAPFLGAVGEEVFHRSFGLDASALREGGDAMLRADGDLGESLMAAASGLRGLSDLRRRLDEEADQIFAERKAGHRRFYQAVERFDAAKAAIRASELSVGDWKKRNEAIDALGQKLEQKRADRRENAGEQSRLIRLKRAAPVLRAIADDEAALAGYSDLPAFAPGAMERLRAALEDAESAAKDAERAHAEETRLAEDLAQIAVDETVLSEADAIEELFQQSGGHAKARGDLPRIQTEAEGFLSELRDHARALGLEDAAALDAARPTAFAVAELRKLISEGRQAEAAHLERAGRLAKERKEFEALRQARDSQGEAIDPGPLREKFAALGKVGELGRRLAAERVDLSTESRELAEAAARLRPPAVDFDALAKTPLPRADDLDRFSKAFEKAAGEERDAAKGCEDLKRDIDESTVRLATLNAGAPLATAEAIANARSLRDAMWRALRSSLLRAADAPPEADIAEFVAEFESRSAGADRLSDQAGRDAERLAAHRIETERLDGQTRHYALALARRENATARRTAIEQGWAELWSGVCARPQAPAEMRAWSDRVGQLLIARSKLVARRAAHDAAETDLVRIEPALRTLAVEAGAAPIEELDCARLAERVERRLDELARDWQASLRREAKFAEARRSLDRAAEDEADAASQLTDWRKRWAAAVAAIGLEAAVSTEAAEAALTVWDKALNAAGNHRNRVARVDGIKRDMQQFEAKATELVRRCAPQLAAQPAEASARVLNERLAAARKAETRRQGAEERLRTSRRSAAEAQTRAASTAQTLATVGAALPSGRDLAELLAREGARSKLAEGLSQRRVHLIDLADGVNEARLAEEVQDYDPDAVEARLRDFEQAERLIESEINELYAEHSRAKAERDALDGGFGAEAAWQQRRNAEAELAEAARRWTVLKTASALVGVALERHSSTRRDPLLTRAGEIFATLTGGAFAGLEQGFGQDDEPRLEARRSGGERVCVPGLSEGSRDQLYFALRLAYVEDFASRAEAPPFIGDDIFASFDDARTGHGLAALAAIGERAQPILFTHHLHVVEAARARLGDAADVVSIE